jgi:hypothetical protein
MFKRHFVGRMKYDGAGPTQACYYSTRRPAGAAGYVRFAGVSMAMDF